MPIIFDPSEAAETQVETLVLVPGNAGCNNGPMFMKNYNPEDLPGLHFVVIDADGPLLQDRLSPQESDLPDGNFRKWLASDRVHVIQLKDTQPESPKSGGIRRHQKSFGAGGNVEVGRRFVKGSLVQIEKLMENKNLLVQLVGGGGGTGTSVAGEVAKLAEKNGLPLFTILLMPFPNEGSKIAICDDLWHTLRQRSQVQVIRNGNLPSDKKKVLLSDAYRYINAECQPFFRGFVECTQVVGTSANVDLEDLLTAFEKGRDVMIGFYNVDLKSLALKKDELPEIDASEVVAALLEPKLQRGGLHSKALIFCFRGLWTVEVMDEIMDGVMREGQCPSDTFIKRQNFETDAEMWVSVIMVGSYEDIPMVAVPELPPIVEEEEHEEEKKIPLRIDEKGQKPFSTNVNGKPTTLYTAPSLIEEWRMEIQKDIPNSVVLDRLRDEFRNLEISGRAPDIPARINGLLERIAG